MTAIDTIKEQIQQKRAALDKLHDDVEALERTLAILEEQRLAVGKRLEGLQPEWEKVIKSSRKGVIQKDSIPYFAQKFLRETGKPLTKQSLLGALYRSIKKRQQVFRLVGRGKFGLIEWAEGK